MNGTDTYVLHCGGHILHVGTVDEVTAHRDIPREFNITSYEIVSLDDFAQSQYDRGFDSGYDSGYDEASGESYIL